MNFRNHTLSNRDFAPWMLAAIVVVHLTLLSGCCTFDPGNVAERPWNRPTREEMIDDRQEPGYWVRPVQQDNRRPGDHYP